MEKFQTMERVSRAWGNFPKTGKNLEPWIKFLMNGVKFPKPGENFQNCKKFSNQAWTKFPKLGKNSWKPKIAAVSNKIQKGTS